MLEELRKKISKIYTSKDNSDKLKDRVKKEVEIIGEDNLVYLLKITDVLEKNYHHSYSISGFINSFYIAYYLGITSFNPVKYEITNDSKLSVSISIPENEKDNFFSLLQKELKCIKKVSNHANMEYRGIVFDEKNELPLEDGVVKVQRKDFPKHYFMIHIYEKEILSLLHRMYEGNDNITDFFCENGILHYKQIINKYLKYQTPFENIIRKVRKVDLKRLIKNHVCFQINHIDQMILEYKLVVFKYSMPRMFYITYLEYLSNKVNASVILKYQDNFSLFFEENKDSLTLEYKFYSLWHDAKYCFEYLYDLDVTVVDQKIKINYLNINHIYPKTLEEKFNKIHNMIGENCYKEIDIFGYEGNNEYYLSNIIAKQLGIHSFQVASYLNPLGGGKVFFDSEFYQKIDEERYLKVINFYKKLPIFLHTEKYEGEEVLDGILSCTDSGTEIIVIDDYEELLKMSKFSEKKVLDTLNKLNKEIFMFHKIKGK